MVGTVLWGANNIYTVRGADGRIHQHLRLKGKKIAGTEGEHNPLAPGDRVVLDDTGAGLRISARHQRENTVLRWNRTRRRMQAIAANVDVLCVVTSAGAPEYRPAFVDRVLVMAELEEIPAIVIVNKADLPLSDRAASHVATLEAVGYETLRTTATDPADRGCRNLSERLDGRVAALFGQSGVGKSSLINRLVPGSDLATGDVSLRYHRGRHTTTLAREVILTTGATETVLIDTPGVREYDLFGYSTVEIAAGFREFRQFISDCRLPGCTHVHEPGCAVRDGVRAGRIHQGRYSSYTRIVGGGRQEAS